jgi:hypothetical protein
MTYMNRSLIKALIVIIATCCAVEANAVEVAKGCATPKQSSERHLFYVDPVKGNMSNDGSLSRPWRTLAEVVDSKNKMIGDQNTSAPIKPGDVIYLMSGDHGNVQILGAVNKEFITVQAAPGQTPILRSLRVDGAAKWMFLGLKVQGAVDGSTGSSPGEGLVDFGHNLQRGPASDIIFAGGSVSTTDDTSRWTDLDWVNKPFIWGLRFGATCVTINENRFFNLRNAVNVDGDRTLVADNHIDNFGNDGIDLVASHVVIRNNMITNGRHTPSEPMHPDGIQGWTKPGQTNTDVTIERNTIIKTGDPEKNGMQGITIFDGKWDGVRILNNVVVTNTWHGITISGVVNSQIINNTVVAFDPEKHPTWITVDKAKDGTPARDVVIRNNITTRLIYHGERIAVDHNIVAKMIATDSPEKPIYFSKPGTYSDNNIIDPQIYDTLMRVDNVNRIYDLHLRKDSPAVGAGNLDLAPTVDITGKRRTLPIDIGAYAHTE